MRLIDKLSVRIGGGMNHRIGLYDMVMIKVVPYSYNHMALHRHVS